jgi:hypothetical protein
MMLTTIFSSEKQYPYLSQTLERFRALTDTLITAVSSLTLFRTFLRLVLTRGDVDVSTYRTRRCESSPSTTA